MQPELLAHHSTEAGLHEQAIGYWQKAGQRAIERSANLEAIGHLTTGLDVLKALPDTPARTQQELALHMALGMALVPTKGLSARKPSKPTAGRRVMSAGRMHLFPVLWAVLPIYSRGSYGSRANSGSSVLPWPSVSKTRPSSSAHAILGTVCIFRRISSCSSTRGAGDCPTTLSSTALMLSSMDLSPGCSAGVVWPRPCGCWAIQTRRCRGAMKRSRWPKSWFTLRV